MSFQARFLPLALAGLSYTGTASAQPRPAPDCTRINQVLNPVLNSVSDFSSLARTLAGQSPLPPLPPALSTPTTRTRTLGGRIEGFQCLRVRLTDNRTLSDRYALLTRVGQYYNGSAITLAMLSRDLRGDPVGTQEARITGRPSDIWNDLSGLHRAVELLQLLHDSPPDKPDAGIQTHDAGNSGSVDASVSDAPISDAPITDVAVHDGGGIRGDRRDRRGTIGPIGIEPLLRGGDWVYLAAAAALVSALVVGRRRRNVEVEGEVEKRIGNREYRAREDGRLMGRGERDDDVNRARSKGIEDGEMAERTRRQTEVEQALAARDAAERAQEAADSLAEAAEETARQANEERDAVRARLAEIERERDDARAETVAATRALEKATANREKILARIRTLVLRLRGEICHLERSVEARGKDLDEARISSQTLTARIEGLEEALRTAKETVDRAHAETTLGLAAEREGLIDRLDARLREQESEFALARSEGDETLRQAGEELARLRDDLQSRMEDLENAEAARDQALRDLEAARQAQGEAEARASQSETARAAAEEDRDRAEANLATASAVPRQRPAPPPIPPDAKVLQRIKTRYGAQDMKPYELILRRVAKEVTTSLSNLGETLDSVNPNRLEGLIRANIDHVSGEDLSPPVTTELLAQFLTIERGIRNPQAGSEAGIAAAMRVGTGVAGREMPVVKPDDLPPPTFKTMSSGTPIIPPETPQPPPDTAVPLLTFDEVTALATALDAPATERLRASALVYPEVIIRIDRLLRPQEHREQAASSWLGDAQREGLRDLLRSFTPGELGRHFENDTQIGYTLQAVIICRDYGNLHCPDMMRNLSLNHDENVFTTDLRKPFFAKYITIHQLIALAREGNVAAIRRLHRLYETDGPLSRLFESIQSNIQSDGEIPEGTLQALQSMILLASSEHIDSTPRKGFGTMLFSLIPGSKILRDKRFDRQSITRAIDGMNSVGDNSSDVISSIVSLLDLPDHFSFGQLYLGLLDHNGLGVLREAHNFLKGQSKPLNESTLPEFFYIVLSQIASREGRDYELFQGDRATRATQFTKAVRDHIT